MQPSTGLASLLGAYNSDSDDEDAVAEESSPKSAPRARENPFETTSWSICEDKVTKTPYYWNISTKEVTWTIPAELVTYLSYVEEHKDALLKHYGAKRWISHSGQANGSTFYLDELYRTVSWEMPADNGVQRNVGTEPVRMHLVRDCGGGGCAAR